MGFQAFIYFRAHTMSDDDTRDTVPEEEDIKEPGAADLLDATDDDLGIEGDEPLDEEDDPLMGGGDDEEEDEY